MGLFKQGKAIAIDGPAGSGKSTGSRKVAGKLGYLYVDTGAMYRALTLKVMKKDISFKDIEKIIELSVDLDLVLMPSESEKSTIRVFMDGEDVSCDIRKLEVTGNVKYVASIPEVRSNLVALQRKMVAKTDGSVMEGRDIGTVVLPDAKYKFYIDASFEERIERRYAELRAKGQPVNREDVAVDLKERDHADKTRKVGPLRKAKDAVFIDTTDLSVDQVINKIIEYVKK